METLQYFFSYSRKDSDFVLRLAKDLKQAGVKVWLDQLDILPGTRWDDAIEKGLREATGMIVILSETSVQSENVMDEVAYALNKGKRVVPLQIHDCDVPFRLARLQHIDFTGNYDSAFHYLADTLKSPLPVVASQTTDLDKPQNIKSFTADKPKKRPR